MQVSTNTSFSLLEMDSTTSDTAVRPLWGLNDGIHYWKARCRDSAGNWSAYSDYNTLNIAGLLQVALITPDTGSLWAPTQSVWIQFSKPINSGYINGGEIDTTKIKIKGKSTSLISETFTWQSTSRTLMVTPDTCFAANDTITVFIHGSLLDSTSSTTLDGNNDGTATGDSLDSYQMSFRTSYIGDYNPDGTLNASDLLLFAWGWYNYSRYFEAGPSLGSWPHQRVNPGSATTLDFEDLMGFIYSWNQSGSPKWDKSGGEEAIRLEADSLGTQVKVVSQAGCGLRALDAEIGYDSEILELTSVQSSAIWESEGKPKLFLQKQQPGRVAISATLWPEAKLESGELFALNFKRIKPANSGIALNYKAYDQQGKELFSGSGTKTLAGAISAPTVFRLEKAAPNPATKRTAFRYQLPSPARVKFEVFNITGQRVALLMDQDQPAGYYELNWDIRDGNGRKAANGIYIYKLQAGKDQAIGKVTVVR
jgi:hypothetical protein